MIALCHFERCLSFFDASGPGATTPGSDGSTGGAEAIVADGEADALGGSDLPIGGSSADRVLAERSAGRRSHESEEGPDRQRGREEEPRHPGLLRRPATTDPCTTRRTDSDGSSAGIGRASGLAAIRGCPLRADRAVRDRPAQAFGLRIGQPEVDRGGGEDQVLVLVDHACTPSRMRYTRSFFRARNIIVRVAMFASAIASAISRPLNPWAAIRRAARASLGTVARPARRAAFVSFRRV